MCNNAGQTDRNCRPCLLKKSLLLSSCESNSGSPCKSLLMSRPLDVLNFFTASSPDCFCSADTKNQHSSECQDTPRKTLKCVVKQTVSEQPAQHTCTVLRTCASNSLLASVSSIGWQTCWRASSPKAPSVIAFPRSCPSSNGALGMSSLQQQHKVQRSNTCNGQAHTMCV